MSFQLDNQDTEYLTSITSGDPVLCDEVPGWRTAGWVGLARTFPCADDEGKVTIDVNFYPAFVTLREAATLLRVSPSTIRRLIREEKLDTREFGDERRITWESLTVLAEIQTRYPD